MSEMQKKAQEAMEKAFPYMSNEELARFTGYCEAIGTLDENFRRREEKKE